MPAPSFPLSPHSVFLVEHTSEEEKEEEEDDDEIELRRLLWESENGGKPFCLPEKRGGRGREKRRRHFKPELLFAFLHYSLVCTSTYTYSTQTLHECSAFSSSARFDKASKEGGKERRREFTRCNLLTSCLMMMFL